MKYLFLVLACGYYLLIIMYPALRPGDFKTVIKEKVVVAIPFGSSAYKVVEILKDRGVTKHPDVLLQMIRREHAGKHIRAGGYVLGKDLPAWVIVNILEKGKVSLYRVSIPEGLTAMQIANALVKFGIKRVDFMYYVHHKNFFKFRFNRYIRGNSLEGFLFPDTYLFPYGFSAKDLIQMMLNEFEKKAGPLLMHVKKNSRWGIYDRMIVASIVEREALVDEEKSIIASVFFNRLARGRKLQSCATVEYILPEHKDKLTLKDLKIESPYNTYLHRGLPPTPICNPGLGSIRAAVHPAKTDYLYFVLKGGGRHHFSKTYKEHLRYKYKYEKGSR